MEKYGGWTGVEITSNWGGWVEKGGRGINDVMGSG